MKNDYKYGAVIMASGFGNRFGGGKLMAEFDGGPMFFKALEATEKLFEKRVVVTRTKEVEEYCKNMGVDVIFHALPGRNDTVRLGLNALGEDFDGYLFMPCDQPLLRHETVEKLLEVACNNPLGIIRPAYAGTPGAPVLFSKEYYNELLNLPEGKGGNIVVKNHMDKVICVEIKNEFELMDIDTKEDFEKLKSLI